MSTTVRRAKRLHPVERRDQLLDAALAIASHDGYPGVTMHAVARMARVTRPVVYDFFANREELIHALLQREEQKALTAVAHAAPVLPTGDRSGREVDDAILEATVGFLRALEEQPDTWRMILLSSHGTPGVVHDHIEQGRKIVRAQIERVAEQAVALRGGLPDLDLELLAELVLVIWERAARLVLTDPDRYPPERVVTFVRQLLAVLPPGET